MKRLLPFILSFLLVFSLFAQKEKIKITKQIPTTSVKNQAMTGTCWCFATVSFLESELLRMGKGEYDLSEMFYVRKAYPQKAEDYWLNQGNTNFGEGGQAHDIIRLFKQYGAMPESAYSGLLNRTTHDQMEMDAALGTLMLHVVKQKTGNDPAPWKYSLDSIMDVYIGKLPQTFIYNEKSYTPESFAAGLGINPDDYVELTSYTHHPFYQPFVLEVPDNWMYASYYNLPLDELMAVIDNALAKGYTICWDGDVSDNKSFSSNGGVAIPEDGQKNITPEQRQKAFDNFSVTDDHLMQLCGTAKDKKGGKYYLTKNSWGSKKGKEGYWFMSADYVRLKTIAILIHKDALPEKIREKLK
ncbi:MAG: C1 family peptidase [Bacteroidota bacterium]